MTNISDRAAIQIDLHSMDGRQKCQGSTSAWYRILADRIVAHFARYISGHDRSQMFLLPEAVDDHVDADNPAGSR